MTNLLHKLFKPLRLFFSRKVKNPRSTQFTPEKKSQVTARLEKLMEQQKLYLIEGYTVKQLADELKIHQYELSAFLNRDLGLNFNDYLNQQRIRYCEQIIHKGVAGNLNLSGLASKCGFHNRNTFSSAFKKFTGYTPSSYTKRYRRIAVTGD